MYSKEEQQRFQLEAIKKLLKEGENEDRIAQVVESRLRNRSAKFPSDLTWEEITIRFLNRDDVLIKFRDKTLQTDYEGMGFKDHKTKSANRQWVMLYYLAENSGEVSWKDSGASLKLKPQKYLLSKKLRSYFGISTDPFFSYRKEKSYRMKINLIPEK